MLLNDLFVSLTKLLSDPALLKKKVSRLFKDPSNILFALGTLIICFFVSDAVFASGDRTLLVDSSNFDESRYVKRPYNGTIWDKFYITIPAADVKRSIVTTNVESKVEDNYMPILEKSIAHYQGSAYPGEVGNVFLYGHSVLPQFYNPKQYKTIFSHLHQVEIGDKMTVEWGDKEFQYLVVDKKVVDPKDLKAVSFNRHSRVLTVMTCNPPGTYLKRLLIEAEQVGEKSLNYK